MIDPAVNVLEATFTDDAALTPKTVYRPLYRLAVHANQFPGVLGISSPNVFGDASSIPKCRYLICYDISGRLALVFHRERPNDWVRYEPAEETTGQAERYPSVRHVFVDEADRSRYLQLLDKMSAAVGGMDHPSPSDAFELMTILARAPHPPRLVSVAAPLKSDASAPA